MSESLAGHARYFWGFRRHLICPGQLIVGDKGFAGKHSKRSSPANVKPNCSDPTGKTRNRGFGKLALEDHGGRTIPGVYSGVA